MAIKVQKKDGRLEDFDRNKVLGGIIKSGATSEQAESIAQQIQNWLPTTAKNEVIASSEIRLKVLELLRLVNSQAADMFAVYKKTA